VFFIRHHSGPLAVLFLLALHTTASSSAAHPSGVPGRKQQQGKQEKQRTHTIFCANTNAKHKQPHRLHSIRSIYQQQHNAATLTLSTHKQISINQHTMFASASLLREKREILRNTHHVQRPTPVHGVSSAAATSPFSSIFGFGMMPPAGSGASSPSSVVPPDGAKTTDSTASSSSR
jgi:hypothetical protein